MKILAFAFAVLVAGVSAVPSDFETKINERFVEGIIADVIAGVSQDIQDAGLDPVDISHYEKVVRLPVSDLVNVEVIVKNLVSNGLSDIVINRASYSILTSRLRLDISLPKIFFSVDAAEVDAEILDWSIKAGVRGSLTIFEPRINVDVRISLGVISGISIRSISVDFALGGIASDLNVNILGNDYSDVINNFANFDLPNALVKHKDEINELLEYIVLQIAEDL